MFDKKTLIEVTKCEAVTSGHGFKDNKGSEIPLFKISRKVNGFAIEPEYRTKPFDIGYYYPRPFTKREKAVDSKGVSYYKISTFARIGEKYEFPI